MRYVSFVFILILINSVAYSQNYYKLMGDTTFRIPGVIKKCHDGGYISTSLGFLAGYSNIMTSICKMDPDFNIEWQRYYPQTQNYPLAVEASNGDFFFSFTNSSSLKNEIARTDSAGNVLWCKAYSNPNPFVANPILSLEIDNDDNLYLIYSGNQANRGLFAKLDSAGNVLWRQGFCTDLQGGDSFEFGRIGYDSSLYILGRDINILFATRTILIKSDLDGNIKWVIQLPQSYSDFICMPGGDLIVSGAPSSQGTHSHLPLRLMRIDSSGSIRSTLDLLSTNYHIISYSMCPVNGTTFQIMCSANTVPPAMIYYIPVKITIDTTGHIFNSTMYNDTSLRAYSPLFNLTQVPDLSNLTRTIDGVDFQALIYDPDTSGICISSPFPVDSVFLDYSMLLDTMASVILPENANTSVTSITSIFRNNSRDGCLVNQTNELASQTDVVRVYPTPFSDYIKFSIPSNDEYEFKLFDISGKLIYKSIVRFESVRDTRTYSKGVYFYVLQNSKAYFSGKLVK